MEKICSRIDPLKLYFAIAIYAMIVTAIAAYSLWRAFYIGLIGLGSLVLLFIACSMGSRGWLGGKTQPYGEKT